jgi:hypothetical protein
MEELEEENRKMREDLARLRDLVARGTEDGQARICTQSHSSVSLKL